VKSYLPIGIDELLSGAVETARLEFKASWDAETTAHQELKTLCAFANDLQNLNGGYIVIGVAQHDGAAVRPVRGLPDPDIETARARVEWRGTVTLAPASNGARACRAT